MLATHQTTLISFVLWMNDNIKTPGLNNPESYVLTHNRFNTYMVLFFSDLNKAQFYKMPYRDSPHREIEILMSFDYVWLFRPNEHNEDYYIRKRNDKNFLIKIEDQKYIHVGEKLFSFETNDEIEKYSREHGFKDNKFSFAHDKENIYFMLHQKYIRIQEYESSTRKSEYEYLYKMDDELKENNITVENEGVVEYGNDFINCKTIQSRQQKYHLNRFVII